ncbi:MAG: nodulation protein NfeD, partial [Armatimonadetes bacterium]|nr:nodulation protein NfeD [Armatimonadota bacterium]
HAGAMREIAQMILSARTPVVVYVTPSGARAASAGAVIGLAAHVLAMAPSTNIGAAHPVMGTGGDIPGDMRDKVVNDMSAFVRTVAARRGKSVEWAEGIVQRSIASTEEEARKEGVADLIAADRKDLLRKLDGRAVKLGDTAARPLRTIGLRADTVEPTWAETLLLLLFDGNVTLILGAVAFYGIIVEVQNPGAILPGVAGSIALVLSLYSMSVLSVNAAGVALLLLAGVLFVVDVYAPTHGILTAGGVTAFIIGSLMLFRDSTTGAQVSLTVVLSLALVSAAFCGFVVGSVVKSRRMPPGAGPEALLGARGKARTALNPEGKVFVDGAIWRAVNVGLDPIAAGDPVIVKARDGLILKVARAEATETGPVYRAARPTGEERG